MFFKEVQKFRQVWIWLLLIGINGLFVWGFVQQIIFGIPWGNKPTDNTTFLVLLIIPISVNILILWLRLETEINENGIYYRFIPFHFKRQTIYWTDVEKIYVRQYKPIVEYGGWGIRGSFGNGKAYNVSGNMGLQIELKNGKKILLGTKKSKELEVFLQKMK